MAPLLVALVLGSDPRVGIIVLCDESETLHELAERAARALPAFQLELGEPEWRHVCVARPDQGAALLEAGRERFFDLNLSVARTTFLEALSRLEDDLWLESPAEVYDLFLYLGWIELEYGHPQRAATEFRRSLRLWPSWRPTTRSYPPNVVDAYEHAATESAREPVGALAVRATPPGAVVSLNGVVRCESPCELTELVPGHQFVSVNHPVRGRLARRIAVRANSELQLAVDLSRDLRGWLWARIVAEDHASLAEWVRGTDADVVVLFARSPAEPESLRAWVVGDRQVHSEPLGDGESALNRLTAAVDSVAAPAGVVRVVEPSSPLEQPAATPATPKPSSGWWMWTAIVVGAAVIAGATAYAVWATNDDVRIRALP